MTPDQQAQQTPPPVRVTYTDLSGNVHTEVFATEAAAKAFLAEQQGYAEKQRQFNIAHPEALKGQAGYEKAQADYAAAHAADWQVTHETPSGETVTKGFPTQAAAQAYMGTLPKATVTYIQPGTGKPETVAFQSAEQAKIFSEQVGTLASKGGTTSYWVTPSGAKYPGTQLGQEAAFTEMNIGADFGKIPSGPSKPITFYPTQRGGFVGLGNISAEPTPQPETLPADLSVGPTVFGVTFMDRSKLRGKEARPLNLTEIGVNLGKIETVIEKPFTWVTGGISERVSEFPAKAAELKIQGNPLSMLFVSGTVLAGATAGAFDIVTFPFRPSMWVGTVKGVGELVTSPGKVLGDMASQFEKNPLYAAGYLGVQATTLGVGAYEGMKAFKASEIGQRVTGAIPVPKYGSVKVPLEGGAVAEWRGLYLSKGEKAIPLIGKISDIPEGTKILGHGLGGEAEGYIPRSNIESTMTLKAMEKAGYSPEVIGDIENIRSVISETQFTKSKFIEDILPEETSTLSEAGVRAVKEFVIENKAQVEELYGSFSTKAQLVKDIEYSLPTGESALRIPGDIDIQLKVGEVKATQFASDLTKKIKATGVDVRVSAEKPTLIEANVGEGRYVHAVDIHFKGEVGDVQGPVGPIDEARWGFRLSKPTVEIEDIKVMSAAEQGIRKGSSIMGFEESGGIGPVAHRAKDIPDFFQIQETLLRSKAQTPSVLLAEEKLATLAERFNISDIGGENAVVSERYSFRGEAEPSISPILPASSIAILVKHPSAPTILSPSTLRSGASVSIISPSLAVYSPTPSSPSLITSTPSPVLSPSPQISSPSISPKISKYPSPSPSKTKYPSPLPSTLKYPSPSTPSPKYPSSSPPTTKYPSPSEPYYFKQPKPSPPISKTPPPPFIEEKKGRPKPKTELDLFGRKRVTYGELDLPTAVFGRRKK